MKILLTGEPHVGKSTLIKDIISDIESKQGFITSEIKYDAVRTGFELVAANGKRGLLASVDSESEVRVSRYGVNVGELDRFIESLLTVRANDLLYIDEIGQMGLYSEAFKILVREYLSLKNDFIGTLTSVYKDDFIEELHARDDIEVIHLTLTNRDIIKAELKKRVAKYVHY